MTETLSLIPALNYKLVGKQITEKRWLAAYNKFKVPKLALVFTITNGEETKLLLEYKKLVFDRCLELLSDDCKLKKELTKYSVLLNSYLKNEISDAEYLKVISKFNKNNRRNFYRQRKKIVSDINGSPLSVIKEDYNLYYKYILPLSVISPIDKEKSTINMFQWFFNCISSLLGLIYENTILVPEKYINKANVLKIKELLKDFDTLFRNMFPTSKFNIDFKSDVFGNCIW